MAVLQAPGREYDRVLETGLRPFDISRDLRAVAELISVAFATELDDRGNAALREMRIMSHFGGFLGLMNRSGGEFNDMLSGFVWVDAGRVVGNVTVQRADRAGNVMIEGVLGVQKEAVLASKRSVVTVEEIVDELPERSLNAIVLPHWTVDHVVEVPGGAFPSYAQGYYPRTNSFYKEWDAISREREPFLGWMKENVLMKGPEVFAQQVRKFRVAAE